MKVAFPCFSMENKLKLPVISVAVLSWFLGCHIKDKSKSLLFPLHPSIDSQISINLSLLHGLCGLSLIYRLSSFIIQYTDINHHIYTVHDISPFVTFSDHCFSCFSSFLYNLAQLTTTPNYKTVMLLFSMPLPCNSSFPWSPQKVDVKQQVHWNQYLLWSFVSVASFLISYVLSFVLCLSFSFNDGFSRTEATFYSVFFLAEGI